MDIIIRTNQRRGLSTQCVWDRARSVIGGIRAGELKRDHVAVCAYLQDSVCQKVFYDFVRNNCFLYFEHALKNREPRDIIPHLRKWGWEVTIKAACGVIRAMARKSIVPLPTWYDDLAIFSNVAHSYVPRRLFQVEPPVHTKLYTLAMAYRLPRASLGVQAALRSLVCDLKREDTFPGISSLRIANGHLDDGEMLEGMLEYLRPWALGDYA